MDMTNKETLRRVWISEKVDACEELDKPHLDKIISQVDDIIKGMTEDEARKLL
jgi:hypothetical protein